MSTRHRTLDAERPVPAGARSDEREGRSPLSRALDSGHALIPYLTACDPSCEASLEAIMGAVEGGARVLEIGIPFSDPVADGPVIQEAHHRALKAGGGPGRTLALVRALRASTAVPVVLFTYLNPVLAFGLERFAREARDAGAQGVLLLDLPPAEERALLRPIEEAGLDPVILIAPNTTRERAERLVAAGGGFVYLVSRSGVTGTRAAFGDELEARVRTVKALTDLPVVVGFGVAGPQDVRALWSVAEGAVVGSALVRRLQGVPESERRAAARGFARWLTGSGGHEPAKDGERP